MEALARSQDRFIGKINGFPWRGIQFLAHLAISYGVFIREHDPSQLPTRTFHKNDRFHREQTETIRHIREFSTGLTDLGQWVGSIEWCEITTQGLSPLTIRQGIPMYINIVEKGASRGEGSLFHKGLKERKGKGG